jgi:hypothetical protein
MSPADEIAALVLVRYLLLLCYLIIFNLDLDFLDLFLVYLLIYLILFVYFILLHCIYLLFVYLSIIRMTHKSSEKI